MARTMGFSSAAIALVLTLTGCGLSHPSVVHPPLSSYKVHQMHSRKTMPSPIPLQAITMVTSQKGWGLAPGNVVVTHNGGRAWRKMTPQGFPVTSTQLLNNSSMAAAFPTVKEGVIAQEQKSSIRLWRTTDGGIHWTAGTWKAPRTVILRVFHGPLSMQFANAHDGLIILSSQGNAGSTTNVLLSTTDGGIHWHLVHNEKKISAAYLGPSPSAQLADVGRVSLQASGWGLATINTVIGGRAWVLTTTNSGFSWTSRTLPLPYGSADDSVDEGAQVTQGSENAWLWLALFNNHTNRPHWFLEHTTDGGAQWTQIPWTHPIPQSSTLGGVYLWALGQRVLLLVADAQGTEIWQWVPEDLAWQQRSHLPVDQIQSVSLLPNGDGWVIGDTGIYQTTNGGATWRALSPHMR